MPISLCFNCGEIKIGVLCDCEKCKAKPIDDLDLNMQFSNLAMSEEMLQYCGNVIKTINMNSNDAPFNFWVFISYISKKYPEILKVSSLDNQNQIDAFLDGLDLEQPTILSNKYLNEIYYKK